MPDWNPDREGHRKHKWVVQDATRERLESVPTSKGALKFNDDGRLLVSDPALAHEIRTSEMGRRAVTVSRVNGTDPADRGHTYFFGSNPGLPWAKYDEFGRRIYDAVEVTNGEDGSGAKRPDDSDDSRDGSDPGDGTG